LDVSEYIKRFESENRDIAAAKREILNAVAAKPGDRIADIGAGTGMFTREFARIVGPNGRVYPVEISPSFLSHIISEAEKGGYASVLTPVLGTFDSSMLPPDSVDIVFLCSTYHHFGHPERNLASIHRALKPGGRVVLIDFDRERAKAPFAREHARAPKEVYFAEFEKAGLTRLATKTGPKMADNFYAEFTKPAK
jgi:ubiquinone/menaquinone biosynthesis C-methylase UbiE